MGLNPQIIRNISEAADHQRIVRGIVIRKATFRDGRRGRIELPPHS